MHVGGREGYPYIHTQATYISTTLPTHTISDFGLDYGIHAETRRTHNRMYRLYKYLFMHLTLHTQVVPLISKHLPMWISLHDRGQHFWFKLSNIQLQETVTFVSFFFLWSPSGSSAPSSVYQAGKQAVKQPEVFVLSALMPPKTFRRKVLLRVLTAECAVKEEVCIAPAVIHSGLKATSGILNGNLLAELINKRCDLSGFSSCRKQSRERDPRIVILGCAYLL